MDVRSIKQIAEEQNVSYEAIRKQVARYSDELKDHIIRKSRTQYLDEWAVNFLKEKRAESPIILMNMDQNEQIEELTAQVESLKTHLLMAQEQIISLQEENKRSLETQIKYNALLEDTKAKDEKLQQAEQKVEEQQDQIRTMQTEAEDLRRERDEAQAEADSFERSIFGFYRKK